MVGVRAGSSAGNSDDDPDDGDSDHLQRQGLRENFNGNAGAMEDGLWVQVHRRHRGKGGFQRKNFKGTVPNAFSDQETGQRESIQKRVRVNPYTNLELLLRDLALALLMLSRLELMPISSLGFI